MAKNDVTVCKQFTFDSSHQLIGHRGKCANLHGHTYKVEVFVKDKITTQEEDKSSEGFVIDFTDLKEIVKKEFIDPMDHAFLASGNEPILPVLQEQESKIYYLGFRSTCENMASFLAYELRKRIPGLHKVRVWETPTGYAEVKASDIPEEGPTYETIGSCDCE